MGGLVDRHGHNDYQYLSILFVVYAAKHVGTRFWGPKTFLADGAPSARDFFADDFYSMVRPLCIPNPSDASSAFR